MAEPNFLLNKRASLAEYPLRPIVRPQIHQPRHAPHPRNVRNSIGFLGLPNRRVVSDDDMDSAQLKQFYFSPSKMSVKQFVEHCQAQNNWQYDKSAQQKRKTHNLDSINALQYFTGLRSFSFKENYAPYIGYRDYYDNWRSNLRNLTEVAYVPLIESLKKSDQSVSKKQHPYEWLNTPPPHSPSKSARNPQSPIKTMYSPESGRIKTSAGSSRKSTPCKSGTANQRPPTVNIDLNELDANVFLLLSDLIQTDSPLQVQKWLCQASEREKALVISMIQTALNKEDGGKEQEMQTQLEIGTQTSEYNHTPVKTPVASIKSAASSRMTERSKSQVLIVHSDANQDDTENIPEAESTAKKSPCNTRPPTSSTFKCVKSSVKSKNQPDIWIPEESVDTAK